MKQAWLLLHCLNLADGGGAGAGKNADHRERHECGDWSHHFERGPERQIRRSAVDREHAGSYAVEDRKIYAGASAAESWPV